MPKPYTLGLRVLGFRGSFKGLDKGSFKGLDKGPL